MKVGDLVKLKTQVGGQPEVGVVYERTYSELHGELLVKCLWDDQQWNDSLYFEYDLEVISEGR